MNQPEQPARSEPLTVADDDDPEAQAARCRNDRYLREFIEDLSICPYARMCREQGRLYRAVFLQSQPTAKAIAEFVLSLEPLTQFEIGLLLFPNFAGPGAVGDAHAFERLVSEARNQYGKLRKPPPGFFLVAFHPTMPSNLSNPDVAVRFMRRSPDPTIQLVRPEVIDSVRNPHHDREDLSTTIAESGLRTVRTIGPDKVTANLDSIHRHGRPPRQD